MKDTGEHWNEKYFHIFCFSTLRDAEGTEGIRVPISNDFL